MPPTRRQWLLIILMGLVFGLLLVWLVPEIMGIVSEEAGDTYSEWVWDQNFWAILGIAVLHGTAGVLFVWSAGHFIEGYASRRRRK